jgi:hypothetical protein
MYTCMLVRSLRTALIVGDIATPGHVIHYVDVLAIWKTITVYFQQCLNGERDPIYIDVL